MLKINMIRYRPEIDGLRALAVVPVIFFHAGFEAFSGGFVGVDVFFVISGYLITSIILSQKEAGTFSLLDFYERRARRILPALFFVMAVCIPFALLWLFPSEMKDFAESLVAVSLFSSNHHFLHKTDYFAANAELKPLLHTWSLAVEEQYYLLFPLLVLVMWRFGRRWIVVTITIMAIVSFAFSQWGAYNKPDEAFFLLSTRAWEIAIGALLAFFIARHPNLQLQVSVRETGSLVGFFLILYSVLAYGKGTPFPGFYALAPTLGAALIIFCATRSTLVGRILATKVFVGIGLISYSAYLWHQPLFAFARHRSLFEPSFTIFYLLIASCMCLAYLTWRFIEIPFRSKEAIRGPHIFASALIGSSIFIAIGLIGKTTDGIFNRPIIHKIIDVDKRMAVNFGLDRVCTGAKDLEACRTSSDPEVLVWGDSYAMHLVQGLIASNANIKLIQKTVSVCGPILEIAPTSKKYNKEWARNCIKHNDNVYEYLKNTSSIRYVVMSSPFGQYVGDQVTFLMRDGQVISDNNIAYESLLATIGRIQALGKIPVVFSPPPRNGKNIGRCLAKAVFFEENHSKCDFMLAESYMQHQNVYEFLKKIELVSPVIWLNEGICRNESCKSSFGNVFIYRDSGHLSHEGSAYLGKQMNFYQMIENAVPYNE